MGSAEMGHDRGPAGEVCVGARSVPLGVLLDDCLRDVRKAGADPADGEYAAARRAFLAAGLAALDRAADRRVRRTRWIQVGVTPVADAEGRLYGQLAESARELLAGGVATDFFYLHKPPGVRIRFAVHGDAATAERLREIVSARADDWLREHVVRHREPGGYEPEAHLFGGEVSMRSVHRLFTADSLAWLRFLADDARALPAWAYSLILLRDVLDGVGVAGWEDRDVWDRVRRGTGRGLPADVPDAWRETAVRIRAHWRAIGALRDALPEPLRAAAVRHRVEVAAEAERWTRGYFATEEAEVGPRQALAYYTVFHWNRGRLALPTQCLLADALAGRTRS
ncbi:thiopeptide-type bacteriocin biosynthesis protein [Embleya scabrispora]|nr:thiopeptide-type bacteriocin biosynthesis protein [Embleya scabrispora]